MTVRQVLERAIKRLRKGWGRRDFRQKHAGRDCYCALGAIGYGGYGGRATQQTLDEAKKLVKGEIGEESVVDWNDRQTRKRVVIRAFEKALKKLDQEAV